MPSAKELAKALAYRGEIRNTPQNSFLGGVANFLSPVSEFLDRGKLPESIPLLGGISAADVTGVKGAESLVRDMSYGKSPVRGATLNTAKVDPRLLDLAAVSGAMIPVGKALGKAALREGARQIETGTGIGRAALDPRMGIVPEGQAMSAPAKQGAMNDGSQDVITYIGRKGQKFQITKQRDNELLDIHSSIADKAREIFGDGVESFDSGMSSSRYVKLPNGAKIRVSDHPLPSDFAAMHGVPDVEVRGGQDLQKAIDYMIDAKSNKTMPNSQKRYDDLSLRDELRSNGVPLFAVDARQIRKLVNSSVGYDDIANQLQQKYPKLTDSDAAKIYTVIGRGKFDKFDSSKTPLRLAHEVAQRNAALPVDQGGMLDNVGGAMMQRPKTEFEILHDTAQRNAALPVEQGGLGLPSGNTAMDRAKAMGFDTDNTFYHGTRADIPAFDMKKVKERFPESFGIHTSNRPSEASIYADDMKNYANEWNPNAKGSIPVENGANVMPLLTRNDNQLKIKTDKPTASMEADLNTWAIKDSLWEKKKIGKPYNSVKIDKIDQDPANSSWDGSNFIAMNPATLRSRFAAFDPMRRHEADILAGVGVGGMLDPQAIAEALRQQDRK